MYSVIFFKKKEKHTKEKSEASIASKKQTNKLYVENMIQTVAKLESKIIGR